jgi:hypothetical protein
MVKLKEKLALVKGTKQAMLTGTVAKCREMAGRFLMVAPNVRQAVYRQTLKGNAAVAAKVAPKSDRAAGSEALAQMGKALV